MNNLKIKSLIFEGTCPNCGRTETREVTLEEYHQLIDGKMLIQRIFPTRTPAFREFFIPNAPCTVCWRAIEQMEEDMENDF